jgi:preprotein translocase subunit SecF
MDHNDYLPEPGPIETAFRNVAIMLLWASVPAFLATIAAGAMSAFRAFGYLGFGAACLSTVIFAVGIASLIDRHQQTAQALRKELSRALGHR